MNELHKTHSMLNKLEELNNSKFNSSDFISLHTDLQISLNKLSQIKEKLSIEDKSSIINLISKIESLEAKILPKADLINSFSKSRI